MTRISGETGRKRNVSAPSFPANQASGFTCHSDKPTGFEQQAIAAGFEIIAPPVHGGSACVYRAKHLVSGKLVALKVLNPWQDALRVYREAKALKSLQHPNIVQFHDVGEFPDSPFLATQWIEGQSLKDISKSNSTSIDDVQILRVLCIARQIADALQHAHDHGVIHGDLGPANILVSESDHVTIIDFGIGRVNDDSTVTALGDLAGTPRYLAPEVIRGSSPTHASDQYALALLIYEMLTGRWPFDQSPTAATSLHHQLYSLPTPLIEVVPEVPVHIDRAINKALSKRPDSRHDCMTTFINQLTKQRRESSSYVRKIQLASSAALLTALCVSGWWLITTDQQSQTAHAEEPACNLFNNAQFNNELEQNFYRDANNDLMAARVQREGVNTSPVLKLGDSDIYGMYGVIIEIEPNQRYRFEADLWFVDYVHKTHLSIVWLDSSWQEINDVEYTYEVADKVDDRYVVTDVVAPGIARYAVPTVFKDASTGVVFADNLLFAPIDGNCEQP